MNNNLKPSLLKLSVALILIITIGLSATLFIYADKNRSQGLKVMVLDDIQSLNLNELTYSRSETEEVIDREPNPTEATDEDINKDEDEESEAEENPAENGEETVPDQEAPAPEKVDGVQGEGNSEAPIESTPEGQEDIEGVIDYNGDLNQYVLAIIKTYKIGRYPYLLNEDYENYNGVTMNLFFKDQLLLKAHPSGNRASHCVGLTFEVMLRALQARNEMLNMDPNDINGMSFKDMYDMALIWFVSSGNKETNNIHIAVEKYGIGRAIHNLEDAKAGDFIDISRENNTGHTGVFMNWIKKGNKIIGFRYWSTQTTTDGINYRTEYFNVEDKNGEKYGNVRRDLVFISRINAIEEYKSFK